MQPFPPSTKAGTLSIIFASRCHNAAILHAKHLEDEIQRAEAGEAGLEKVYTHEQREPEPVHVLMYGACLR